MNSQALHTRLPPLLCQQVREAAQKTKLTVSAWISCACAHALHFKMAPRISNAPVRGRKKKVNMNPPIAKFLVPLALALGLAGCGTQAQLDTLDADAKILTAERAHQDQLLMHVLTDWRTETRSHEQDLYLDALEEIHTAATTPDPAIAMTRAAAEHHALVLYEIETYYADVVISHASGQLLRADHDRLMKALRKNIDAGALTPQSVNALADLVGTYLDGTLKEPRPWAESSTDSSPTTQPPAR